MKKRKSRPSGKTKQRVSYFEALKELFPEISLSPYEAILVALINAEVVDTMRIRKGKQ